MSDQHGESQEVSDQAVAEQLKKVERRKSIQENQVLKAALMISQYNHVLSGLHGKVPSAHIYQVAATLAAGISLVD